jgi:hypothetical protein
MAGPYESDYSNVGADMPSTYVRYKELVKAFERLKQEHAEVLLKLDKALELLNAAQRAAIWRESSSSGGIAGTSRQG